LFKLKNISEVERYILNEVQKIYLSEGATINNKHIEIIAEQIKDLIYDEFEEDSVEHVTYEIKEEDNET